MPNIRIGIKIPGTQIHHRVIFAQGRIMVMGLHNSDDSDSWERDGEDHEYFKNHSEKVADPIAINIIFYIMTHWAWRGCLRGGGLGGGGVRRGVGRRAFLWCVLAVSGG